MNPEVQKTSFPKDMEHETVVQHTEVSCTQRCRKYYFYRGRSRNGAGAQRTLMHPEVQKTSFPQRKGVEMLLEHREPSSPHHKP